MSWDLAEELSVSWNEWKMLLMLKHRNTLFCNSCCSKFPDPTSSIQWWQKLKALYDSIPLKTTIVVINCLWTWRRRRKTRRAAVLNGIHISPAINCFALVSIGLKDASYSKLCLIWWITEKKIPVGIIYIPPSIYSHIHPWDYPLCLLPSMFSHNMHLPFSS